MPSAVPVVLPDSFALYASQSLTVLSAQGVLANDTADAGAFLSVTAVNGQTADVGNPITLASGALLQVEAGGSFVYTPAIGFFGPDVFDYTASDGENSATTSVTITSVEITLDAIADQEHFESDSVSLQVSASVSHGPPLDFYYIADNLPAGLNIDSTTGLISGTIAYGAAGTVTSTVSVQTANTTATAYQAFEWVITPSAVTFDEIADQQHIEGDNVSLPVVATNPTGAALTYSATGLPDGLSIDSTTGLITGLLAPGSSDDWLVTVTAESPTQTVSVSFNWVIDERIAVAAIDDQWSLDGDLIELPVTATSPDAAPLTFSATGLPDGLTINPTTGVISGMVARPEEDAAFFVVVHATDGTYTGSRYVFWMVEVETFDLPTAPTVIPWSSPDSPYFARNEASARWRAWQSAPADVTRQSPIGDAVAAAFDVAATMTWDEFFPLADLEQVTQGRTETAAAFDPVVLRDLDADWRVAQLDGAYSFYGPIGETVAQAWQGLPGFDWVQYGTSWEELYPFAARERYAQLRAAPIPTLTFSNGSRYVSDLPAIELMFDLDNVETNGVVDAVDLGERFRTQLLPRLRYATIEDLAAYVRGLDDRDRAMVRFAVGLELARPDPTDRAFCELLYAEMHHLSPAADYGVRGTSAPTFEQVVQDIRAGLATDIYFAPDLLFQSRGTILQRAAFLAATDYETYQASESDSGLTPLSPADFYRARDILLQTIDTADRHGENLVTAVWTVVQGNLPASTPGETTGLRASAYLTKWGGHGVALQRLYDRFLHGADNTADRVALYPQDSYAQANLASKLVAGWATASAEDRELFAGTLWPTTRDILRHALLRLAAVSYASGDATTAVTAGAMADFLAQAFERDRQLVAANPAWQATFDILQQATLSGVSAETAATLREMPRSMQRLAIMANGEAISQATQANATPTGYTPSWVLLGVNWDPWLLNAADVFAPVYRTGLRLTGGSIDGLSNLDGVRAFMNGQLDADIRASNVDFGALWTSVDLGLSVLTVLPLGAGSRAAISGGWFLPASAALARNQLISGGRHLAILTVSGAAAATALTAIDASSIPEEFKGTARLIVGLAAGVGTGLGMQRALPTFQSPLIGRVAAWTAATRALAQTTDELAVAGADTVTLLARQARLQAAVAKLVREIDEIRAVGGQALETAEANLKAAQQAYDTLLAEATAAGAAPSARVAALRTPAVVAARKALAEAKRAAAQATDEAGAQWLRNGKRIDPPEAGTGLPGSGVTSRGNRLSLADIDVPDVGNKMNPYEIIQVARKHLSDLGVPRKAIGKQVEIIFSDALCLENGGPGVVIRNGRYTVIFPESVGVPDWVVYEEICHLGQFIKTFGLKGVAQLEARNAAFREADRVYTLYTSTGHNLDDLVTRLQQEPDLRRAFEESIRYLEIEPAAKDFARQQVRSAYQSTSEWDRVVDAQSQTLEGYLQTMEKYRALLQRVESIQP